MTEPVETDDLADEIAEAISDTLDMDWQPSWAAPNIIAIINRVRREAADEIEVLRAELARVRACLERIERFGTNWQTGPDENLERVREMARAALATWNAEAAR